MMRLDSNLKTALQRENKMIGLKKKEVEKLYFIACEIFTQTSVGGHSVESEWEQVFSGLHNFSQYSSRS